MEISQSSKFLRRVLLPAIRGQTCPICLENLHGPTSVVLEACKHAYCETCIGKWSRLRRKCPLCNAAFDSWFSVISFSAGTLRRHRLQAMARQNSRRFPPRQEESDRRRRFMIDSNRRRTTPLPWRRSFGRSGDVGADVGARRKLQWRESIYEQGVKAVALSSSDRRVQNVFGSSGARERILRRIEPWIRRELQAILKDPNPSVIVHVASSLYIAKLEKKDGISSELANEEDRFLAELRPFLLDKTEAFWHELRCFAESSFTMETYDSVVEYA